MKIQKIIAAWLSDESSGQRTAEYLAQRAGLSGGLLRMILRGERKATPETLIKLAPVLGVPAIRLLVDAGYLEGEGCGEVEIGSTGKKRLARLDRSLLGPRVGEERL